MRLFDTTLRDGGNVVGNGFPADLTESIVRALIDCGIKDIELGNAKGMGSHEGGSPAPLDDAGYIKLIAPCAEKGRLGMFALAGKMTEERAKLAKDGGLNFIRVGANAGDGAKAVEAVKTVKKAGLVCRYSLMKGYVLSAQELAAEAKMLEDAGVDIITIMDSAGTMFPADAAEYTRVMKQSVKIPVGFHGHSNLGLSQANALAAAEAGAEEIDCGLLGMARSAGNCSTEIAAATLLKEGKLDGVDLYKLLDYLDSELIPAMKKYDYHVAVCPEDLVLGLTGTHSSYQKTFRKAAAEEGVSLYRLYAEVAKVDRKAPSEELIRRTAAGLK